jgi:hypothetical protein
MRERAIIHRSTIEDDVFEALNAQGFIEPVAFAGYWQQTPPTVVGDRECRARRCYYLYDGCPFKWLEVKDEWVKAVEAYENRPSKGNTPAERVFHCFRQATSASFCGEVFADMAAILRAHPQ